MSCDAHGSSHATISECSFTDTDGFHTPLGRTSHKCACCRPVIGICPASLATCHTGRSRSPRTNFVAQQAPLQSALFWAAGDHTCACSCLCCGQRFRLTILLCNHAYESDLVCRSVLYQSQQPHGSSCWSSLANVYVFVQILSAFNRLQASHIGHPHGRLTILVNCIH